MMENQCKICKLVFRKPFGLKSHIMFIHENPKSFKCWICDKLCNTRSALGSHMTIRHLPATGRFVYCPKCNKSYAKNESLTTHISICNAIIPEGVKIEPRKFHCPFCTAEFLSIWMLGKHMVEHGNSKIKEEKLLENTDSKKKKINNMEKGKKTIQRSTGIKKRKNKSEVIYNSCEFCQYKTINKSHLKRHVKRRHRNLIPNQYSSIPSIKVEGLKNDVSSPFQVTSYSVERNVDVEEEKINNVENKEGEIQMKSKAVVNEIKNQSEPIYYSCELCPHKTKYKRHLKRHIMRLHPNSIQSQTLSFPSLKVEDWSNDMPLQFPVASSNVQRITDVKKKKINDTGKKEREVQKKSNTRVNEMKNQPEAIYYSCEFCQLKTKYKQHLKRHIKRLHPNLIQNQALSFPSIKIEDLNNDVSLPFPVTSNSVERTIKVKEEKMTDSEGKEREIHLKSNHLQIQPTKSNHPIQVNMIANQLKDIYFKCEFCQVMIKYKRHLIRHIKRLHPNLIQSQTLNNISNKLYFKKRMFKCRLCDFATNYEWNCKRHEVKFHRSEIARWKLKAGQVSRRLRMRETKIKEKVIEREEKRKIQIPPKTAREKCAVKNNQIIYHKCKFCQYSTKYIWHLIRHTKRLHRKVSCLKDYMRKIKVKMEKMPNLVKQETTIKKKLRPMTNRNKLMNKKSSHEYNCTVCDFTTKYKTNLFRHERSLHMSSTLENQISLTNVKVKEEKMNGSEENLKVIEKKGTTEMEIVKKNKYFYCKFCEHKTKYKENLKRHTIRFHPKSPQNQPLSNPRIKVEVTDDLPSPSMCLDASQSAERIKLQETELSLENFGADRKTRSGRTISQCRDEDWEWEKFYNCQFCNHLTKYAKNLKRHMERQHPNEKLPSINEEGEKKKEKKKSTTKAVKINTEVKTEAIKIEVVEIEKVELNEQVSLAELFNIKTDTAKTSKKRKLLKKNGKFQCRFCHYESSTELRLKQHEKSVHFHKKSFKKCHLCEFTTKELEYLSRHMKHVHKVGSVTFLYCAICGFKTPEKYRLKRHLSVHFPVNSVVKCSLCDYTCKHEYTLQRHKIFKHEAKGPLKYYYCDKCSFKTCHQWQVNRHRKSVHKLPPVFTCRKCESQFPSMYALKCHHWENIRQNRSCHKDSLNSILYQGMPVLEPQQERENGKESQMEKCTKTESEISEDIKLFSKEMSSEMENVNNTEFKDVKVVENVNRNGVFYGCKQCNKKFVSRRNLKKHVDFVHREGGKESEKCEIVKTELKVTHSNQCHLCFVTCWTPQALSNHLKRHVL